MTPTIDFRSGLRPRGTIAPPPAMKAIDGREVLHAPIHSSRIQKLATAEHPAVKARLQEAIAQVKGAKIHGARDEKDEDRLAEKVKEEGQSPRTIPDYSGFRVAVDSHEAHQQAVDAIRKHFGIRREKDEFEAGAPDTKFHSHMLQIHLPGSEVSHEVQVLPRPVADAAEANHADYEKARTGDAAAGERMKASNEEAWSKFEGGNKPETKIEPERKYKFGNTQAAIPRGSMAHQGLESARKKIDDKDLAGDGKDIGGNHVTVRYGIQDDEHSGVEKYIRSQKPFDAKLGKTSTFPPSKHSDDAAVIKADVDSPDLHRMNTEIEKHGNFAPSSFPDYKPHATVAYVKPETAQKYVGMAETHGAIFKVRHIAITDRDGNAKHIPLEGKELAQGGGPIDATANAGEGGRGESPESAMAGGVSKPSASTATSTSSTSNDVAKVEPILLPAIAKGSSVVLQDGTAGKVQWIMGGKIRLRTIEGDRRDATLKEATAIPSLDKTGGSWDGVDVDGTVAHYEGFKGATVIGAPIPAMQQRVREWLAKGKDIRLFTARVSHDPDDVARHALEVYSEKYLGRKLPITNKKDSRMQVMFDDRAVQVSRNKGTLLGDPDAAADVGGKTPAPDIAAGLKKRA